MRRQIMRELNGLDTAHRIMGHEGKCRRLHGHRYVVQVIASTDRLDDNGRVVDFSVIKGEVGAWCDSHLDHGTVLQRTDPLVPKLLDGREPKAIHAGDGVVLFVDSSDLKLLLVDFPPTAENLAELIYAQATALLQQHGVEVDRVLVYETPSCCAVFPWGSV